MHKKLLWAMVFLFAIFWLVFPASADLAGYYINNYHVDMQLNNDGSMAVKETIDVFFTEPRRGIYRSIPTRDPDTGRVVSISHFTSTSDPVASNSIVGGNYELTLWSANRTITGPHTYVITYTVDNAIVPFGTQPATGANYVVVTWGSTTTQATEWQEFYRNVIWKDRATTIDKVSFSIKMWKPRSFLSGESFLIYGRYWAKNTQGATLTQVNEQEVKGEIRTQLAAYEAATVGLQFPAGFFALPANYEEFFFVKNEPWAQSKIWRMVSEVIRLIGFLLPFIGFLVAFGIASIAEKSIWSISWKRPNWKSNKAITPYYLPPKNIEPLQAFWFWYYGKNPRIITSIIYYWATKWWVHIEKVQTSSFLWLSKKEVYNLTETNINPHWTTNIELETLEEFFWPQDTNIDTVELKKDYSSSVYNKFQRIFNSLRQGFKPLQWENELVIHTFNVFKRHTLTEKWEKLFEEMRWFKEYLEKVERPVIEMELKNDPEYINKILPWAVLFWIETKLLYLIGDLIEASSNWWYSSYDGSPLNIHSFNTINSSVANASTPPSSSWWGFSGWGGWISWFSWWWGFSGWGWGGWWWGSW